MPDPYTVKTKLARVECSTAIRWGGKASPTISYYDKRVVGAERARGRPTVRPQHKTRPAQGPGARGHTQRPAD